MSMFIVTKRDNGEYTIQLNVRTKSTIPTTLLEKYNNDEMVVDSIECNLRHRLYERLGLKQLQNKLQKDKELIQKCKDDLTSSPEWNAMWETVESYFNEFLKAEKREPPIDNP